MEDIKKKNDIDIYVLTCPGFVKYLQGFDERFQTFWGGSYFVYVNHYPMKQWSTGVLELMDKIDSEYVILLHEDFYLDKPVDLEQLEFVKRYVVNNKVDRLDLTSNEAKDRSKPYEFGLRKHLPLKKQGDFTYHVSFEASIWRVGFLKEFVGRNEDAWTAEKLGSRRCYGQDVNVLHVEEPIVHYNDAVRRGVQQI